MNKIRKGSWYAEMFSVITHRHCQALLSMLQAGQKSIGGRCYLFSRFTLHVPLKESMLRHIRKSFCLIKPLIFCVAGALLKTMYRDSRARRRTPCGFYGETLLILRKTALSWGYGCRVVCTCVVGVFDRVWERQAECVWRRNSVSQLQPGANPLL